MKSPRLAPVILVLLAVTAGTLADRPRIPQTLVVGGYRVLAVDFHTHSSIWSDGTLTPWGLVLEAERHGLDAIAITGHNQVSDGQLGRWFSRLVRGPTVLTGEEIVSPTYHLIAVGIEDKISFRQPAAAAIDVVHRQGGIAIAAHPLSEFWAGYDEAAMRRLDGAEICHPIIYSREGAERDLQRFAARAPVAAIGSSDFHGFGPMGLCRTYVFARDTSAQAILEAVRAHRTVVYMRDGRTYGDATLIAAAGADRRLRENEPADSRGGPLDWLSRIAGLAGLSGLLAFGVPRRSGQA